MNLYEQITIIRKRPGNYIGTVTLNNIEKFIDGALFSLEVNKINDDFDDCFKKYFSWFVNYKLLNVDKYKDYKNDLEYNGGRGFVKLIEVIEKNNSNQTMLFFELFDAFYLYYKKDYNFQNIVDKLKK